ncbi:MAG: class I SAM-dependent methyltransferase [Balneolales bacterium]
MAHEIKNILVNHLHDKALKIFCKRYLSGDLIDIGCGKKPYAEMLASVVTSHTGLDHPESLHSLEKVDLVGTAYKIPAKDASFDCAISTAVLEHLEEPETAIREANRVLKQGGYAIYSVPFIWHIHEEPRDFYRYSKYGLAYLFEKAGFEVIEIKPLSGFCVTFGQLLVYYMYRFHKGPLKYIPIIPLFGLIVQGISFLLYQIDNSYRWTWMYMAVVRKK